MRRAPGPAYGLALLLLLLGAARAALAQATYVDEKYGYTIRTVPKWEGVPVQPTEPHTVAKWAAPRDERGLPGRMFVHLFEVRTDDADPATADLQRLLFPRARSFQEWAERHRSGLKLEAPGTVDVKMPGGGVVKASLYELTYAPERDPRFGPPPAYFTVIALIALPERQYAVELLCAEAVRRKYRNTFLQVVQSFTLLGSEPKDNKEEPAPRPNSAREAAREEARRRASTDAERVAGWWYVESENYFIVTNTPVKKKARITELHAQLEAIRALYQRDFPPPKPIDAVSIVRVCKDHESYRQYGGPAGSGGYWNAGAKELVLFHRGEKAFARGVLFHEAFHQYIYYACGEINPHIWYNEGHADYYGGAEVIGSRALIRPNRARVDTIRGALRAGTYVPLPEFLRYSQRQYYANAGLCYAQGWSLAYFLNQGIEAGHPWSRIVPTYYKTLVETGDGEKALQAAFQQVDLGALDAAWKEFIIDKRMVRA
ncbi:MAG: hypothetical protein JXQ29_11070 [Planctomycetes bacterium]|nr:hypothetical protein [Planctomycetota bacterium]